MSRKLNSENSVKKHKDKDKIRDRNQSDDIKFILGDRRGRRFLWKLLGDAGIYKQSYAGSGSDTFFHEGKRSVGLKLLIEITGADEKGYLMMMQEMLKEQNDNKENK